MALFLLAGCAMDGKGGDGRFVEVENKGNACLLGHEPAGSMRTTFVADQPVEVNVSGFACLSSSCTTDMMARCEARLEGTTIIITTIASWRDTTEVTGICTDDCASPFATCMTPPLPAGTYSVSLPPRAAVLEVPSMTPSVPCLGGEF